MAKKVIVIGAGIGGLATAIILAKNGNDVTVYEKNNRPGGRCGRLAYRGFTFDTGPTMYLFPQLYDDFFSSVGENLRDYVTLLRADPRYRLFFADRTSLTISDDPEDMERQLERIEPGSYGKYRAYISGAGAVYRMAMERIVNKPLARPGDYFNATTAWQFFRHRAFLPHYGFIRRFFTDARLGILATFQDAYLSLDPYTAPAICSLFAYGEHAYGSYLPRGGMYRIAEAITKIARKNRVEIVCASPVESIRTSGRRAAGVVLADGTFKPADYVVANCDMGHAKSSLLRERSAGKFLRRQYSCSAVVFHWALSRRYPGLATHNLFFGPSYRDGFRQILDRAEPPRETHFYVQAPARTDPGRAPAASDALSVMVPVNHIRPEHPVDWKRYAGHLRAYVLERLANAGIRDVGRHILHESCFTPPDWQSRLNLTHGAIYGLHHGITQLGYLRPARRHVAFRNLFFVGADTHPGSSLPTVLKSAQYTGKAILEDAD